MLIDEVKKHFGSSYAFARATGMHHANYQNWKKKGYIPIKTQHRIEVATQGHLKADYNHCSRSFNESTGGVCDMEVEVQAIDTGIDTSGLHAS